MRRLALLLVSVAALAVLSLPFEVEVAQAADPTLTLNPSSGPPPDAAGTLSGGGWLCSGGSAPTGSVTLSGADGSAYINRDGSLGGEFQIFGGSAGQVVDVTVTAYCDGIVPVPIQKTAPFTFNAPTPAPTNTRPPTSTRTPVPTSTPTPLPATVPPPPPTNTPAPGVTPPTAAPTSPGAPSPVVTQPGETPASGESPTATPTAASEPPPGEEFLLFDGCTPASPVTLEFVPLYLVGTEQPDPKATGPGITVPAVQAGDGTGQLLFKPPEVPPGRLFRVTPKTDDGDCAPEEAAYWLPGERVVLVARLKSETTLEICRLGDKSPCEKPQVKGAFIHRGERPSIPNDAAAVEGEWDTEKQYFAEDLTKGLQRFRSATDLAVAGSGKLQASVLPFPKGAESDPSNVQGLVASWDIACVNCEFTVDLSPLAPAPKSASKSWYKSAFDVVAKPFKLAGDGVGYVFGKIGDLVGIGGDKKSPDEAVQAINPQLPQEKPSDSLVAGALNPLLQPTTYYFRLLLPVESNPSSNAASNPVRMQQVDKPEDIKIPVSTPTSTPTVSPYEVAIAGYHGILPPLNLNKICYVATQDAWLKTFIPTTYTTNKSDAITTSNMVHAGQLICQPDPEEPDIFEAILSWAEYVVDWASEAWSDLKAFAVDVVLKYTPLGALCTSVAKSDQCTAAFNMALDAVLVAAGIPPDIPNFHELMDQGLDYVAAQAAAQVGIPADVVQEAVKVGGPLAGMALDEAEAKLRAELEAQIKAKLGNVAKQIELDNAKNVSWVPDGIPVRKDDYLPPAATLIVTRKPGVPGGEDGCSLKISDTLKLSKEAIDKPLPGYEWVKSLPHPLNELNTYDLFADEAGGDIDKSMSVPALGAGESFTIPLTFRPDYYHSGWTPNGLIKTSQYISVWHYLHKAGMLHLSVFGSCGQAKLDTPADSSVIGAQVVP